MTSREAKVRRLLAQATTEGEREACRRALERIQSGGAGVRVDAWPLEERVAGREPLEGWEMRVARRLPEFADAIAGYRWNPSDDTYYPEPFAVGCG